MEGRRAEFDMEDPEYKALYDQMVLEEMEKMEQYFKESMEMEETTSRQAGRVPPPLSLGGVGHQPVTNKPPAVMGLHRNDGNWLDDVQLRSPKRNVVTKLQDPEPQDNIFRSMGSGRDNDRRKKQSEYARQLANDAALRGGHVPEQRLSQVQNRDQSDYSSIEQGNSFSRRTEEVAFSGLVTDKKKKQEDYARALQADASRAAPPVEFVSNKRQAQPQPQRQEEYAFPTQSSVASIGLRGEDERMNKRAQQQQYAAMLKMQQAGKVTPAIGFTDNVGFDTLDHHLGPGFSKPNRRPSGKSVADETDPYYHLGDDVGKIAMIGSKPGSSKEDKRNAQARYAAEIRAAAEESLAIKARSGDAFQLEKRRSASTPKGVGVGTAYSYGESKPAGPGVEGLASVGSLSNFGAREGVNSLSARRSAQVAYYEQLKMDEELRPIPKEKVLSRSARRNEDTKNLPVAGISTGVPSPKSNRQALVDDSDYHHRKRNSQLAYRQALEEDSRNISIESSRVPLRSRFKGDLGDEDYIPPAVDPNLRKMTNTDPELLAYRKKLQQQQYAQELEEDLLRSKEQLKIHEGSQRYSQPRRVSEPENTSYAIGSPRRDASHGHRRVSNVVFKNDVNPGGITYYEAALAQKNIHGPSPTSNLRERSNIFEPTEGRQGSSAPYATIPKLLQEEEEATQDRGSLRRVQDFKARKEAWDRLQANETLLPQEGPRSPYKYMNVPDSSEITDNERAAAREKAVRRKQQEQYAREISEASNRRPIEIPRESTLRQTYLGTGIPGDSRPVNYANMQGELRIGGGPHLRRGEPDPTVDIDTRGWKGKSSGGGASSFTLG